jgi:hypothetical protein
VNHILFITCTEIVCLGKRLRQDLKAWLHPPDPWENHNTAREAHLKGTAKWFIRDNGTFAEWKQSGRLLWLRGNRQDLLPLNLYTVTDDLCFCSRRWKDHSLVRNIL